MKLPISAAAVAAALVCVALESPQLAAHEGAPDAATPKTRADGHAPIGVMGDHAHFAGEWMLSYRYMRMDMDGNRIGTDSVGAETIATTEANRFSGMPGQPPTLRVVPEDMVMDMHMFGLMFAPTDWLTLMAMVPYVEKSMDHVTFQGGAGMNRLGTFTTETSGLGDVGFSGLVRLLDQGPHHFHLNLGLTVPTGSTDETDRVLAPNGMRPVLRLPYPMQLGSGTVDVQPGITYSGRVDRLGWGAQYVPTIRIGENDEDYSLGDVHRGTAWASWLWAPWVSTSARIEGSHTGEIDGIDSAIVAPVQTADPDRQGGDRIDLGLGVNLAGTSGWLFGHRIAFEYLLPLHRDLDGPQLETDGTLVVGYQFTIY